MEAIITLYTSDLRASYASRGATRAPIPRDGTKSRGNGNYFWRSISRSKGHGEGGWVTGYGKGQHPYDTGPKGFHLTYHNMDLWEIQFSPMPLTCKYGDLWPHPLDAGVMTQSGQNEVKLPWGRPMDWHKKIRSNRLSTWKSQKRHVSIRVYFKNTCSHQL